MFVLQGAKKREKCPFRFEKLSVSFLRLYMNQRLHHIHYI